MVTYFIGGSVGTYITSLAWSYYRWPGVCSVGISLSVIALAFHLFNQKTIHQARHGV
ncbi:MAG: MFS transporter, partial [Bacteroidetes bacterium]|nr:MFS transporter [Bacteroidota bacterium]